MPKVTVTYDLPEEFTDFQYALRGRDWAAIVDDMIKWLKAQAVKSKDREAADAYDLACTVLWDIQANYGLSAWIDGGEVKQTPESGIVPGVYIDSSGRMWQYPGVHAPPSALEIQFPVFDNPSGIKDDEKTEGGGPA